MAVAAIVATAASTLADDDDGWDDGADDAAAYDAMATTTAAVDVADAVVDDGTAVLCAACASAVLVTEVPALVHRPDDCCNHCYCCTSAGIGRLPDAAAAAVAAAAVDDAAACRTAVMAEDRLVLDRQMDRCPTLDSLVSRRYDWLVGQELRSQVPSIVD